MKSFSTNEHAKQLISNILVSSTQEEVKENIDKAMNELAVQKSGDPSSFANVLITELEIFNPMKQNAQQWSNIHMARVYLHHFTQGVQSNDRPL